MKDPDLNQIICGDNVKIMQGFPDNIIDLTVTSPPYDDIREYDGYSFDFEGTGQRVVQGHKTRRSTGLDSSRSN